MPKRKAPSRKKTLAETDKNVDSTDSAVAVPPEPAPPPTKKTRVERAKNPKSGRECTRVSSILSCVLL